MLYKIKNVYKLLGIFLLVCASMIMTRGWSFVVVSGIAISTLFMKKVEKLLFWVFLITISPNINQAIMPSGAAYTITYRFVCTFIGLYGTLLFLSRRPAKPIVPLFGIMVYLVYMLIPSSVGWCPIVSYLKILLFVVVYMSVAYIANTAIKSSNFEVARLREIFLAFSMFIILGSLILIPFPGISYMNAQDILDAGSVIPGSLFKGVTYHSQALGMVTCALLTVLMADLIFNIQKPNKLYMLLIVCGVFIMYKSATRTAMGTFLGSSAMMTWIMMRARNVKSSWRNRVTGALLGLFALASIATLVIPSVRDGVVKFALKYNQEAVAKDFNIDEAVATRSGSVESQMHNFYKRPSIGWGFQVSEQVAEMAARMPGVPLSAPVEKGVWVSAILEEGGIFGGIIYGAYFLITFGLLWSKRLYVGTTIFIALHVSNLGELTMFTMTGAGGIWHMLVFLGIVFDAKRQQGRMGDGGLWAWQASRGGIS